MNPKIKQIIVAYFAAALVMLGLDATWITLTADRLYRPLIGEIMLDDFRAAPAAAFYALYLCAIVVFAIRPALASRRWSAALIYGAFFGLSAYGAYDLTNLATLKIWPVTLTLADMAWGTFLSGICATAGYLAAARWAGVKAPG